MLRVAALIQLFFIILIVGFSTYQLFLGHFEVALGFLPFLMVFYIFVTIQKRRKGLNPEIKEKGLDSGEGD